MDRYFAPGKAALLSVRRLPRKTLSGKYENFTVANLLRTIAWPPNAMERLTELNRKPTAFRGHIGPARNRLGAHLDKTSFLGDLRMGEFPKGQDREVDEGRPSFVSPVSAIFTLKLAPNVNVVDPDGSNITGPTVQQLIERGHVIVE